MADDLTPDVPNTPDTSNYVNLVSPGGQLGSVPPEEAPKYLNVGYKAASEDDLAGYEREQKYGSPAQMAITAVEHGLAGATLHASTPLEVKLGLATPEDIEGRTQTNPLTSFVSEGAGLAGSAALAPEISAAKWLGAAGKAVAELVPGTGVLSKIGSLAVQGAVENGLYQGTDEAAKLLVGNNPQSASEAAETALTNIGLASLIGAPLSVGFGSISPLWKAAGETKLGKLLKSVTSHLGGSEGGGTSAVDQAIETSGVQVAPEVKAAMSEMPELRQMGETLLQTDTNKSGLNYQKAVKAFEQSASESVATSLGREVNEIPAASELSKYEIGKNLGQTAARELQKTHGPLAEEFEALKEKAKDVALPKDQLVEDRSNPYETKQVKVPGLTSEIADKLGHLAENEGWNTLPDSEIMGALQKTLKALPRLNKLSDLTKLITQVGNETADFTNPSLSRAGQLMKNVLRDAEGNLVMKRLGEEGPDVVKRYEAARSSWKELANLKDALDSRLKVGGGDSVGSFLKNLKAMSSESGERIFQRLSGAKDADLLNLLSEQLPETAAALKKAHLDQLLSNALEKDGTLNPRKLLTSLQKMSPELRSFAVPAEAAPKLEAIQTLLHQLESKTYNFSNTARTVDKVLGGLPGAAMGVVTMLASHNPALAVLVGGLTKAVGKDVPDAIRLSLLKFMGSGAAIDTEGFKTMVDFIQHTIQGENALSKATKNVFKAGQEVFPKSMIPDDKDRKKLDKHLLELQKDPRGLFDIGGKTAHYLPDHGQALSQTATSAVTYLNSLRPSTDRAMPLDPLRKPSKAEESAYQNALTIAQQPLIVLDKVKKGQLTPQDVKHLTTLYPSLTRRLQQKVSEQMINTFHEKESIPYRTRLNLGLFLGQPLDSSMTAQSILSAQPKMGGGGKAQEPEARAKHSMTALNKLAASSMTPSQARQSFRSMNK